MRYQTEEQMKSKSHTVQINTADKNELQMLRGIGPRLADRIIHHRQVDGSLSDLQQLTKVTGISRKQATRLIGNIDWSTSTIEAHGRSWLLPALVVAVVILILSLNPMLSEVLSHLTRLDGSPTATISATINVAVLLLTLGSMTVAFSWAVGASSPGSNGWLIRVSLTVAAFAFVALLVAIVLGLWVAPGSADALKHAWRVMPLVATVVFVVYMLFGPQLICRLRTPPQLVSTARLFDFSLLPLAIGVLALCYVEQGKETVLHLFLAWAGTMFTVQGVTLARNRSWFEESLDARHADNTLGLGPAAQIPAEADPATAWYVPTGRILLVIGATIVIYATWQLLKTTLTSS